MRIMGLDYGSKTVGVAVSDPLGLTAQGIEIVRRKSENKLTTVEADRTMMETGIRRENRKEYVDMIAAVFILQGYLDYLSHQKESQEN